MWTKRFAALPVVLLLTLLMPGLSLASHAQGVFASGGALFSNAPPSNNLDGTRLMGKAGVRLPYTDLFTLEGAVAYQDLVSLEGTLQFHPFERVNGIKFYGFGGFGYYVAGDDQRERAVVPLGVGAEVPLRSGLALNVETGARWTLATNDPPTSFDLTRGFAPTIGLTYNFNSNEAPPRTEPALPLAEAAAGEPKADGENDTGNQGRGAEAPAEQPAAGDETLPEDRSRRAAETAPRSSADRPGRVAETAPMPDEGAQRRSSGGAARQLPSGADTTDEASAKNEMREVPAGTFVMGLTDEDPLDLQQAGRKRVSVTPFSIDKYEVSNVEYRAFLNEIPPQQREEMRPDSAIWEEARSRSTWETYFRGEEYDDYPVVGVTHEQAQGYCEFYDKRLPTEAEWEYAARGDLVGSIYPWQGYEPRNNRGRYLANYNPDRGGYAADGYAFTAPEDAYPPSSWGLYHMSGNVAEWVQDSYHSSYSELSDFNPLYEDPEEDRYVVRGGSWASNAFYIGVGVRDSQPGDEASPYIGFRCASEVDRSGSSNGSN